jgi:hypothetical protein
MTDSPLLPVPEGMYIAPQKTSRHRGRKTIDWKLLKQEYLENKDVTIQQLSEKYDIANATIYKRSQDEGWVKLRRTANTMIDTMAEELHMQEQQKANSRHILIAKLLQKEAVEAIKKKSVKLRSAKTALEFIVESVRMERDALGMTEQKPQIVNILAQQQGIIDKYKKQ